MHFWRGIRSRPLRGLPRLALLTLLLLQAALLCAGGAAAMGVRSDSPPPAPGAGQSPPGQTAPADAAPGQSGPGLSVPGEVLVRFRADVGPEQRDALLAALEMRTARSLGGQNAYVVALPPGLSVADAIARLQALPEVEVAEPNRITPREPRPGSPQAPLAPLAPR